MTLAAPRSRRGKATLVLAFMAALAALGGAFLWSNQTQANMPATTVTLSQSPATGNFVNPGDTVTYTMVTTTVGVNDNGAVVMTITLGAGLDVTTSNATCPPNGTGGVNWAASGNGTGTLTCTSSAVLASALTNATMTVTADVAGSAETVDAPGTTNVKDSSNNPVAASRGSSVGALNVNGVSVSPASATNAVGAPETFTWTLPAGFTCASDANFADTARSCGATDVTVNAGTTGATVTAGPTVSDTNLNNPATVTVTINGTAAGTATVTLATKFQDDDVAFIETPDVSATKTYQTLAQAGDAHLQHVDIDNATEDVADDSPIDFDGVQAGCDRFNLSNVDGCQVYPLTIQDDPDDSTGSLHTACLISGLLGAADDANIQWNIQTVNGAADVHLENISGRIIMDVDGQGTVNDDPEANCIQWRSANPGGQTITATYLPTGEVIGWDDTDEDNSGIGDPPLIKQWNTIDSTSIVSADGDVGDTLAENTGELDNWSSRDSSYPSRTNWDGSLWEQQGAIIQGPVGFGRVDADGVSFIDYTFGQHDNYSGPVDGAEQTYTVGGDCGSVRLEDPVTGQVIILGVGESATVLSSDKGVAFEIVPNNDGAIETTGFNADCDPSSHTWVDISTREDVQLRSDLDTAPDETVKVHWTVLPPGNKQPQLAWAGQRVVLEHSWLDANGDCPWGGETGEAPFYVRYAKQSGHGALVSDLGDGIAFGPDFMIVQVLPLGDSNGDPNVGCVSRVIYEAQDQGEEDIVAHVVEPICPSPPQQGFPAGCDWSVVSQQVAFVVYYMKLEDVTLGLVPGCRLEHNDGNFTTSSSTSQCPSEQGPIGNGQSVWDASGDVTEMTANVSADVLARVRVRGYLERQNCPVRDAGQTSGGAYLPPNRCIFPDDWEFIAGGALAEEFRPNYDIMKAPDTAFADNATCDTPAEGAAGPFSWLDPAPVSLNPLIPSNYCGDSLAPHVNGGQRETVMPDRDVDSWDAPMPPALVRLALSGSGFIRPADKASVYTNNINPFYVTHIPAEPWITPINEDLTGYQWNTWGIGSKSGLYDFWTDLADSSAGIVSCAGGSNPCNDPQPTGGYSWIKVYTDNHGEAMAYVNGDANLTFDECANSSNSAGHKIVLLSGWYCEKNDVVGHTTLTAAADYPDKRKHEPLDSNDVSITWKWGGIKEVTVEPGENAQFNYVVLHVTDRDGFCGNSPSLHPVLGEAVSFLIDSTGGVIVPNQNGDPAADLSPSWAWWSGKEALVATFDSNDNQTIANGGITIENKVAANECQAWIHISSSLLDEVNVLVTADDPEGTPTFDVVFNEPTPVPTTPPAPNSVWGDIDCDDDVDSVDALGGLRWVAGLSVSQTGPCHQVDGSVTVDGGSQKFGDWNCDGTVDAVDALYVLRWVAGIPLPTPSGCPAVGSGVDIS